jgi:putative nucleotidyltransferase with HDIG domain
MVNSAFFGLATRGTAGPVVSIERAAVLLGFNAIQYLALASSIFVAYEGKDDIYGFSLSLLQKHSFLTARLAARVAAPLFSDPDDSEAAFVAGLLHDTGKLILAGRYPHRYRQLLVQARKSALPLVALEEEEFGATHAQVGAYLFGTWGLPNVIVEAVAYHHEPSQTGRPVFDVAGAVHVAETLACEATTPANDGHGMARALLDVEYLDAAGLLDRLPTWRGLAADLARRF